jgi:flagellar hook-length control protein FliK
MLGTSAKTGDRTQSRPSMASMTHAAAPQVGSNLTQGANRTQHVDRNAERLEFAGRFGFLNSTGRSRLGTFGEAATSGVTPPERIVKQGTPALQTERNPVADKAATSATPAPPAWGQYLTQLTAADSGARTVNSTDIAGRIRAEVVKEARYLQGNGTSRVEVQLEPPELGRIRLQVTSKEGKLEVRVEVENPDVRQALQNDVRDVQGSLRDAQLNITRFDISDYQSGAGFGRQESADTNRAMAAQSADDAEEEAREKALQTWVVITTAGKVDCLV